MEDFGKLMESLLEGAADYGKTSYELVKLKALDKTSDFVSWLIPCFVVLAFSAAFLFFINLGLAFWLGEILGKLFFGFFALAAFYSFAGIVLHFFMHKWIKKIICNYIIKQALK